MDRNTLIRRATILYNRRANEQKEHAELKLTKQFKQALKAERAKINETLDLLISELEDKDIEELKIISGEFNIGRGEGNPSRLIRAILQHYQAQQQEFTIPDLLERYPEVNKNTLRMRINQCLEEGTIVITHKGRGRGSKTVYGWPE